MQGLEVALTRLATTLAGTAAKSLLAPRHGAGLVPRPLRSFPGRPPAPERLARTLGARLTTAAYADLPEHEHLAAVDSVTTALEGAGALTPERLFALDLDPERLRASLSAPPHGASPRAHALYEELLGLCCAHLVEQTTAQPTFPARAAVEQTRAAARTERLVQDVRERVGQRPDAEALAFEQRYADFVAETQCRMSLFGLTLGRSAGEWPLDTAYISLAVTGENTRQEGFGMPEAPRLRVKAEHAVCTWDRTLLRGAAGSGKSTLVQWLALNAARRTFAPELADWNRCVPFVLRLRSFAAGGELPTPDDFLRTLGVPFHGAAPSGWADALLRAGRALVLIDGVDEVPARLRARTEKWLRDLLTAYPAARYVVTTRPSAVAEDWLTPQGFASHALLPMERDDIRAFVRHWHDAARRESGEGAEGGESAGSSENAQLTTYETGLLHAVTTRRDLGRLATNPLMCALLCALNRDRRMHLPRARKELYDAALDMLLVRRDTEREVVGVEGVDLTREEQTSLLQRLAYWLTRNGHAEAERGEVVDMLTEWLRAMPQIDGTPEQVFAHLLIRSGLLREPAPGHVDFVHRTFQDYLGARAAVEAHDFGVLVRHAHDPQWDDVVRMAVGHARADERAVLLRKLLARADAEESVSGRLVLLAAACLEHAPELDPAVREEVERRTEELLPPTVDDAESLAEAGELVLELLPGPEGLDAETAAAVVRTAGLVGGDGAFELIARFEEDGRERVALQRTHAWNRFDAESYAREILAPSSPDGDMPLSVLRTEELRAMRHIPRARRVTLSGPHPSLASLCEFPGLESVSLTNNPVLDDLSPLSSLPALTGVGLHDCPAVLDLSPLRGTRLKRLTLSGTGVPLPLEPLRDMPALEHFVLYQPSLIETLEELPLGPRLRSLWLSREVRYVRLDGIERWTELDFLALGGSTQVSQLQEFSLTGLTGLAVHLVGEVDAAALTHLSGLELLRFGLCDTVRSLAALRDLPSLTTLELNACAMHGPPIDLTPLADADHLTIQITEDTRVTGAERIPPERLVRSSSGRQRQRRATS